MPEPSTPLHPLQALACVCMGGALLCCACATPANAQEAPDPRSMPRPSHPRLNAPSPAAAPTVALRYRLTDRHLVYADLAGQRGVLPEPLGTPATNKVGMEWTPAKKTLGFEHGALGVQLDSGVKLALKTRRGGPVVYLKSNF